MDRRKFLLGASAAAVSAATPSMTLALEHNEIALGYAITRKQINDNLYMGDVRLVGGRIAVWDGAKWLRNKSRMYPEFLG